MAAKTKLETLVPQILAGEVRAIARAITLVEDGAAEASKLLSKLFPHTGKAQIVGVTGPPGAGKSTLVDQLAIELSRSGKKVGILAVDPSSPFTGGALLGDRIRMARASELTGVYIRSMASRGAVGGLAPKTAQALFVLDAAGFDVVIVETVGVGQGEVDIIRYAETVLLVLVPGMGDGVQALKAGIIEIADVFVINKADHEGAMRLEKELLAVLSLGDKSAKRPAIVKTVATEGKGIAELVAELEAHRAWAASSGQARKRTQSFLEATLEREIARLAVEQTLKLAEKSGQLQEAKDDLAQRKQDPLTWAKKLLGDSH